MDVPITLDDDGFHVIVQDRGILSLWYKRPSRALCAFFYLGSAKVRKDATVIGFLRHPTIATINAADALMGDNLNAEVERLCPTSKDSGLKEKVEAYCKELGISPNFMPVMLRLAPRMTLDHANFDPRMPVPTISEPVAHGCRYGIQQLAEDKVSYFNAAFVMACTGGIREGGSTNAGTFAESNKDLVSILKRSSAGAIRAAFLVNPLVMDVPTSPRVFTDLEATSSKIALNFRVTVQSKMSTIAEHLEAITLLMTLRLRPSEVFELFEQIHKSISVDGKAMSSLSDLKHTAAQVLPILRSSSFSSFLTDTQVLELVSASAVKATSSGGYLSHKDTERSKVSTRVQTLMQEEKFHNTLIELGSLPPRDQKDAFSILGIMFEAGHLWNAILRDPSTCATELRKRCTKSMSDVSYGIQTALPHLKEYIVYTVAFDAEEMKSTSAKWDLDLLHPSWEDLIVTEKQASTLINASMEFNELLAFFVSMRKGLGRIVRGNPSLTSVLSDAGIRKWLLRDMETLFSKLGMKDLSACFNTEFEFVADRIEQLPEALQQIVARIVEHVESDISNMLRDYRMFLKNPDVSSGLFSYRFEKSRQFVQEQAGSAKSAVRKRNEFELQMMMFTNSRNKRQDNGQNGDIQDDEAPVETTCAADGCSNERNRESGVLHPYCGATCAATARLQTAAAARVAMTTSSAQPATAARAAAPALKSSGLSTADKPDLPMRNLSVQKTLDIINKGQEIEDEFQKGKHWYMHSAGGFVNQMDMYDIMCAMTGTQRANNFIPLKLIKAMLRDGNNAGQDAAREWNADATNKRKVHVLPESMALGEAIQALTQTHSPQGTWSPAVKLGGSVTLLVLIVMTQTALPHVVAPETGLWAISHDQTVTRQVATAAAAEALSDVFDDRIIAMAAADMNLGSMLTRVVTAGFAGVPDVLRTLPTMAFDQVPQAWRPLTAVSMSTAMAHVPVQIPLRYTSTGRPPDLMDVDGADQRRLRCEWWRARDDQFNRELAQAATDAGGVVAEYAALTTAPHAPDMADVTEGLKEMERHSEPRVKCLPHAATHKLAQTTAAPAPTPHPWTPHTPRGPRDFLLPGRCTKAYFDAIELIRQQLLNLRAGTIPEAPGTTAEMLKLHDVITPAECIRPHLRNVLWDCRAAPQFPCVPLDLTAPQKLDEAGVDVKLWAKDLRDRGWPDEIIVDGLDNGFRMPSIDDEPLMKRTFDIVLGAHLLSLADGFASVDSEVTRMSKLEFMELFENPPFFPFRAIPQGSTSRKYEVRFRRTSDHGAPRHVVFPEWYWGPPYTIASTNTLIHEANIVKERKPRTADRMWDFAMLQSAVDVGLGTNVVCAQLDFKDYFPSTLYSHPSEYPFATFLWDDAATQGLAYAAEHRLTFGGAASSNFAQRLADSLIWLTWEEFAKEEDLVLDALVMSMDPSHPGRKWLEHRAAMKWAPGRSQRHLASPAMYSDDPQLCAVGADRLVRLLAAFRRVVDRYRMEVSIPRKHQMKSSVEYLGWMYHLTPGLAVVEPSKAARALKGIQQLLATGEMVLREYRSLCGLAESLFQVLNLSPHRRRNEVFYGVYGDTYANAIRQGPETIMTISAAAQQSFKFWRHMLTHAAGTPMDMYATNAIDNPHPSGLARALLEAGGQSWSVKIFADAASDVPQGGLGGYAQSMVWHAAVPESLKHLTIAALEAVAFGISACIFGPIFEGCRCVSNTDSSVFQAIEANDAAKTPELQTVHRMITELHGCGCLTKKGHFTEHLYSSANLASDAASRLDWETLNTLARQLGMRITHVPLNRAAWAFLRRVEEALGRPPPYPRPSSPHAGVRVGEASHPGPPWPSHWLKPCAHTKAPPASPAASWSPRSSTSVYEPAGPTSASSWPTEWMRRTTCASPPDKSRPKSRGWPTQWLQSEGTHDVASTIDAHLPVSRRRATAADTRPTELRSNLAGLLRARATALKARYKGLNTTYLVSAAAYLDRMLDEGGPASRGKREALSWRYWSEHTRNVGVDPARLDNAAHTGLDWEGHLLEVALLESFVSFLAWRLRPRSKAHKFCKPDTITDHVRVVRAIHSNQLRVTMASTQSTKRILESLRQAHIDEHGPTALLAARKEPFRKAIFNLVFNLPDGTKLSNNKLLDWSHPKFKCIKRMATFAAQTGNRKAEMVNEEPGHSFSRGHVSYRFDGVFRKALTAEELARFQDDDDNLVILRMVLSKSDFMGLLHTYKPIYLRWTHAHCAAARIIEIEQENPISLEARETTPLFMIDDHHRMTGPTADYVLKLLLEAASQANPKILPPDQVSNLSWHSFRSNLACQLLEAGATDTQICHILRWVDPSSLDAYARLTPGHFADIVERAMEHDVDSRQAKNLPYFDDAEFLSQCGSIDSEKSMQKPSQERKAQRRRRQASSRFFSHRRARKRRPVARTHVQTADSSSSATTPPGEDVLVAIEDHRRRTNGFTYLVQWREGGKSWLTTTELKRNASELLNEYRAKHPETTSKNAQLKN